MLGCAAKKLGYRIHNRYLVIREGSKIVLRVVELDACGGRGLKIPLSMAGVRTLVTSDCPRVPANTFVVGEEEESVPHDGPAKGCAKDVLGVRVLGRDREVVSHFPRNWRRDSGSAESRRRNHGSWLVPDFKMVTIAPPLAFP